MVTIRYTLGVLQLLDDLWLQSCRVACQLPGLLVPDPDTVCYFGVCLVQVSLALRIRQEKLEESLKAVGLTHDEFLQLRDKKISDW